jgi:hypothetical protein
MPCPDPLFTAVPVSVCVSVGVGPRPCLLVSLSLSVCSPASLWSCPCPTVFLSLSVCVRIPVRVSVLIPVPVGIRVPVHFSARVPCPCSCVNLVMFRIRKIFYRSVSALCGSGLGSYLSPRIAGDVQLSTLRSIHATKQINGITF